MHSVKKKILLAFDDPGGGLAVSSLLDDLNRETGIVKIIYAGKLSRAFLNDMNAETTEVREIGSYINKEDAERIFVNEKPDVLITGTGGGNAEQELRNSAYLKNIKSIVILDFWKDYSRRWKYADYSLKEMKDIICVMDDLTKKEMEAENFKSENLIVTGHPYIDRLFSQNKKDRAEINGKDKFKKILFLSQPLEIIGVKEYDNHPLDIFLNSVKSIAEQKNKKLKIKIKLHPSEQSSEEISEITKKHNRNLTEVEIVSREISLDHLIEESDLVAGFNSIALFEARAAGRKVLSMRVADINNSLRQAMSDAGIEIIEPAADALTDCINNENTAGIDTRKLSGGIRNCMNVLKKELSIN